MQIECFDHLSDQQAQEWATFLEASPHGHPRQHPRFAKVEQAMGNSVIFAIGREAGKIVAVGQFTLARNRWIAGRTAQASALSGPVCDTPETLAAFVANLTTQPAFKSVDALAITPYWLGEDAKRLTTALKAAGLQLSESEPFRHTGMIDITRSEEEMRSSFSKSTRRKIRLIEKSDIEIRQVSERAEAELFFERLNTLVLERHGLTPVNRAEYEAQCDNVLLNSSLGAIFNAYFEGTFLGGLLVYRSPHTAHARRYVADPGAAKAVSNLRVAPSLWLAGMLWAQALGSTRFDVEGFLPIEDKSHPKFNVYEYKREFKPEYAPRIGEYTLVLNKTLHQVNRAPKQLRSLAKSGLSLIRKT